MYLNRDKPMRCRRDENQKTTQKSKDKRRPLDRIVFDKHSFNESELKFKDLLFQRLRGVEFIGQVSWQEYLVIPKSVVERSQYFRDHESRKIDLDSELKGQDFVVKRPDFIFGKYGLIIEIDGESHDKLNHKCKSDLLREPIYKCLGYDTMVIDAADVYNPRKINRILNEITKNIKDKGKDLSFNRVANARKKRLCMYRKKFAESYLLNKITKYAANTKNIKEFSSLGIVSKLQFLGIAYSFVAKKYESEIS